MTPLLQVALGVALLLLGRRLFWLFVGAVGFVAGLSLATWLFPDQSPLVLMVTALVMGLLGALLALFIQKAAIVVGGFLAGGYCALMLLQHFGAHAGAEWIPFIIGGAVGAVLLSVVFGWALVLLSSLVGALLVVDILAPGNDVSLLAVGVLCVIGIAVQTRLMGGKKSDGKN